MANPTSAPTKTPSKRQRTRNNISPQNSQAEEIILPIAQETERDLLGLLMLEDDALAKALAAGLTLDLFALPSHRLIFKALQEIQTKGWDNNPTTLGDYLESQHSLEQVGGRAHLAELIRGSVPRTKSIPGLLRQLRDIRYKRDAAKKAAELQRLASNGASPDEIEQLLETFPRADVTVQAYAATPSGLIHRKPAKQGFGFDTETLTNFTARIVAEMIEDDGASDEQRFFEIEVSLNGATKRVNVSAKKFAAMTWPTELLGAAAIIEPQRAERAKVAIQRLSPNIQKRTVYTHSGWRQIDGEWCYLHSGGAITANGNRTDVAVKLSKSLQLLTLPEPAKDTARRESYRAVLALLNAFPLHLSAPLLGAVFASVLGDADYSVYVVGESGSFKSELTALAMSFFGTEYRRLNLPANWYDTAGSILLKAFYAKDALQVIDDFAPNGNRKHDEELHAKAETVFRAAGNRAGRGRLQADASERSAKEPRGLLMSSGEDLPKGTSLQARLVIVPIRKGEISKESLSAMQTRAAEGTFASALATFLGDLARDYETFRNTFRADCQTRRDELTEEWKGHARQPTAIAHLASAWSTWLESALLANAINEAEHGELWRKVWQALSASGEAQREHQSSQHPADYFLELLRSALVSGKAYVSNFDGHQPKKNKQIWGWGRGDSLGEHIGWLDEVNEVVCLEPKSCYKALNNYGQGLGEGLPVTFKTLWLRVDERGLMALKTEGRGNRYRPPELRTDTIAIKVTTIFPEGG